MERIRAYALQNAVFHNGRAEVKAVMAKIFAEHKELRSVVRDVALTVKEIVDEVNKMSIEEQKSLLEKLAPEMLVREKKEEGMPELPSAKKGKVTTRFAPSPTGPISLGQFLRAVMLSHYYARRYDGRFIVRIEDTDPKKIAREFYDWIREDLEAMGIDYDDFVLQSDRLEIYYEHAEKMIAGGKAYVCTCRKEEFRLFKEEGKECPCRRLSADEHMERWKKMHNEYREGEAVLRMKTSMSDPNPVLRDPPLMRIAEGEHPLKGTKYRVWPLYNFSCAIDDHMLGITHVFRGKEHEHNTAVQKLIYDFFGWSMPTVINFGMIKLPGGMVHTRDIKQWIKEGRVEGWDDPSLPTIRALLKRGFVPEAIKQYALQCGLSKTDITLSWENLEAINRKIIDEYAKRYMVVLNPVKIEIVNAPDIKETREPWHPNHAEMGKKVMPFSGVVYVSEDDFSKLEGKVVRLKGLFNVKMGKRAEYEGDEIVQNMPKIQWVSEPFVEVELRMPEPGKRLYGHGEINLESANAGDIIQMERVGFGKINRIDRQNRRVLIYFAHK